MPAWICRDTNEGTLGSVMATAHAEALMTEGRHDAGFTPGWPHALNSFGEADGQFPGAAAAGFCRQQSALPQGMGHRSLAAAGAQLSAPPLMLR